MTSSSCLLLTYFLLPWRWYEQKSMEWQKWIINILVLISLFPLSGTTVHYELYEHDNKTERPTFVLVHGFLSSSFSYRRLIPLLAKEGTVIALDLPPFGKSDKSHLFKYSYHNLATIIIDLIEHLSLSNIVLVGHSMGGQISLYVNRIRPELISKTILLCSSSYLARATLPLLYSSYLPFFHLYVKNWIIRR